MSVFGPGNGLVALGKTRLPDARINVDKIDVAIDHYDL